MYDLQFTMYTDGLSANAVFADVVLRHRTTSTPSTACYLFH